MPDGTSTPSHRTSSAATIRRSSTASLTNLSSSTTRRSGPIYSSASSSSAVAKIVAPDKSNPRFTTFSEGGGKQQGKSVLLGDDDVSDFEDDADSTSFGTCNNDEVADEQQEGGLEENEDREEEEGGDEDDDFGITEFTSDEFEVNERCSYYMGRVPISADNRASVEFVYMIEADRIVRSQNTLRRPEMATKMQEKYKQLIGGIPSSRFAEFGLKDSMMVKFFNAKKGTAMGLHDKVKAVKPLVQGVVRELNLSKLPSGQGIIDMKNKYIVEKYKAHVGPVSELFHFIMVMSLTCIYQHALITCIRSSSTTMWKSLILSTIFLRDGG